jgi:hypothetical protein
VKRGIGALFLSAGRSRVFGGTPRDRHRLSRLGSLRFSSGNKIGVTSDCTVHIHTTDHELIPARSASLAAMQGSASGSNVRYYPT